MAILLTTTIDGVKAESFPSGTRVTFRNSSAPLNYVKETSADYNNATFRCVTGNVSSGGNQDFTAAFANRGVTGNLSVSTGNRSLSHGQMGHHHHSFYINAPSEGFDATGGQGSGRNEQHAANMTHVGSSQAHNHSASGNFSGNNLDLRVKYVDLILAQKS